MKYYFLTFGTIFMIICGYYLNKNELNYEIWYAMLSILCFNGAMHSRNKN